MQHTKLLSFISNNLIYIIYDGSILDLVARGDKTHDTYIDGAYEYYYSVWNDVYVGCMVLKEAIFAINAFQVLG